MQPRRALRGVAAGSVLVAATVAGCGDGEPEFDLPAEGTTMCDGLADARLLVEIRERAGHLPQLFDEVIVKPQLGDYPGPAFGCNIGAPREYGFDTTSIQPADFAYQMYLLTDQERQFVPLGALNGVSAPRLAALLHRCEEGPHEGWLYTSASIQIADEDPRVPLLFAQLAVDAANRTRAALGCGGSPLPVPQALAPAPTWQPLRAEQRVCGLVLPRELDRLLESTNGWEQLLTPGREPMVKQCRLRGPGGQEVLFEISRGPLTQSTRLDPEAPQPRIDQSCRGEPVSYRVETDDRRLGQDLLATLGSAAAKQNDCPLP